MPKKNDPSVSLITVTQLKRYSSLLILRQMIKYQKYKNIIEWVIVNGSNNDESGYGLDTKINDEFINIDDGMKIPIKYCPYVPNSKLGFNRNRANDATTGDIIICMDDDDFYPSLRVLHAVKSLDSSKKLIAGCSEMYQFDYDLQYLQQSILFGPNHSTNACLAYKREYLKKHRYDENKIMGEEPSFTNNFSEPMIQLIPRQTCVSSSHNINTFNKRENILREFQTPNATGLKKVTDYTIDELMDMNIKKQYDTLFQEKGDSGYEIIILTGKFQEDWSPTNITDDKPEFKCLLTLAVLFSQKYNGKVAIFSNFKEELSIDNIDFKLANNFRYSKSYKRIMIWSSFALTIFGYFKMLSDNVYLKINSLQEVDYLKQFDLSKTSITQVIANDLIIEDKLKEIVYYPVYTNNTYDCGI